MEEAMTTFTFRSMAFAASLTALIAASASAGTQPTYKHEARMKAARAAVK